MTENIKVSNEADLKREIHKAIKFYEDFHWGRKVDKQYRAKILIPPDELVDLGYLRGVVYETIKGDDDSPLMFFHAFGVPFPILSSSSEGKGLFISGGKFITTRRGIEG